MIELSQSFIDCLYIYTELLQIICTSKAHIYVHFPFNSTFAQLLDVKKYPWAKLHFLLLKNEYEYENKYDYDYNCKYKYEYEY